MSNGTVKWFNGQKGYGFIQPEEGGADVFVHISAVERAGLQTLREGQKVAYETERGRNGKIAAAETRIAGIKDKALADVGAIAEETASAVVEQLLGSKTTKAEISAAVKAAGK